jgi:hypothetical protein
MYTSFNCKLMRPVSSHASCVICIVFEFVVAIIICYVVLLYPARGLKFLENKIIVHCSSLFIVPS